ncbi:MAG: HEAT repeat domain-containing protein [Nostoc indistinguendum CM1-VF10]|nr:HEAT repeat domain-containing protein [Nostoc indistinguendum CM1-VF10]
MIENQWKSGTAAIFMTLAVLGAITLPQFTNATALAQTPSVQPQCTEADIKQHIQQLNKGESTDIKLLVACNSKAVPALIKALDENKDENFNIITIAVLGDIGASAAPAVPVLNKLLNDRRENIRIVVVYVLGQIIGKDWVRPLIEALKDKNNDVRSSATHALGMIGKDAVPSLIIALQNRDSKVRAGAADALGKIGTDAKSADPSLIVALEDPDSKVRASAANALKQIRTSRSNTYNPMGVRERTALYLKKNPPVMCQIPAIRAALKWKCQSRSTNFIPGRGKVTQAVIKIFLTI